MNVDPTWILIGLLIGCLVGWNIGMLMGIRKYNKEIREIKARRRH